MPTLNRVQLIGHLGDNPTVRETNGELKAINFSIATNEYFTDKDGNKQERTHWHRITCFSKLAGQVKDYLSKGISVYIEGRIRYDSYIDKEDIKRYTTDIIANRLLVLTPKGYTPGSAESPITDETIEGNQPVEK